MKSIAKNSRYQKRLCEMNKIKKSATGPIPSQTAQKKHFNIVPVKSKQEEKPWKVNNNSSYRNAMVNPNVDTNLQRNDLSKPAKMNKFQSSQNGQPASDNMKFEGVYEKAVPEKMFSKIQTLTARAVGNQLDAKRIRELMQQLKEQLTKTAEIHKNRTEEVRNQQETTFNKLLNEKNAEIVKLELQLEELSDKLKGRNEDLKDESLMMKKELQQLKEILNVKNFQVERLRDALADAQNYIETLELQKERALDAASPKEAIPPEEMDEHLEIIAKALRSNKKLMKIIETESTA